MLGDLSCLRLESSSTSTDSTTTDNTSKKLSLSWWMETLTRWSEGYDDDDTQSK